MERERERFWEVKNSKFKCFLTVWTLFYNSTKCVCVFSGLICRRMRWRGQTIISNHTSACASVQHKTVERIRREKQIHKSKETIWKSTNRTRCNGTHRKKTHTVAALTTTKATASTQCTIKRHCRLRKRSKYSFYDSMPQKRMGRREKESTWSVFTFECGIWTWK